MPTWPTGATCLSPQLYLWMWGAWSLQGHRGVPGQISRGFQGVPGGSGGFRRHFLNHRNRKLLVWGPYGGGSSVRAKQFKIKKGNGATRTTMKDQWGRGMASRILRKPSSRASRILRTPHRGASRPTENNHRSHCINEFMSGVGPCVCVLWSPGTLFV